jgi:transposase
MVVVDVRGVPVGVQPASPQIAECRFAESTLKQVSVPRPGRGRPRSHLLRVIADRGYDSDRLRGRLKRQGTEVSVPYRNNVRNRRFEDKRKLRRYRKCWKIERTNAWRQNFRRIQVRYDRILTVFQGLFHFACLLITLRHLCLGNSGQIGFSRTERKHLLARGLALLLITVGCLANLISKKLFGLNSRDPLTLIGSARSNNGCGPGWLYTGLAREQG